MGPGLAGVEIVQSFAVLWENVECIGNDSRGDGSRGDDDQFDDGLVVEADIPKLFYEVFLRYP